MTEIKTIKEMKLHGTLNRLTTKLNELIKIEVETFTVAILLPKLKENIE